MERWAGFVARHPWRVVLGWVLLVVVLVVAAQAAGGELTDNFSLPGAESQQAQDLLSREFPQQAGVEVKAVFRTPNGRLTDPATQQAIADFRARAARIHDVNQVSDPFASPGDISQDGATGLVRIRYGGIGRELDPDDVQALLDLGAAPRTTGLIVEFSGPPVRELETQERRLAEIVGIAFALVVLLVAFGSVLAAGIPVITALVALGMGTLLILLAASRLDIVTQAPVFGAMLGIGVGIDYALFVISRFREQLAAGQPPSEAARIAVTTAGRAVAFAGIIVVVALLGLFFIGIPLIANLGLSAAFVVLLEMLIAISLLPALLRIVGQRIDFLSIPFLRYTAGGERGLWYRFSRLVQRRSWLWLLGAGAAMIVCAVPLLSIEIGTGDDGNLNERHTSRRAYDLIADAFGPGVNAALLAVTEQRPDASPQALMRVRGSLAAVDGVAAVAPPQINAAGNAAVFVIVPDTPPQAQQTRELVHRLREHAPTATAAFGGGMSIYFSGITAISEDVTSQMMGRLPIFFGVVIGVSILLLMMAFRSIVVPLKAALMNMLAISASIGLLVAIFQWGWGLGIVGLDKTGPIESFLPMFMFAILFGLSMDYEVFLLSRIRERWLQTGDSAESVAHGIGASARVITAAAAILAAVFMAFAIFGEERAIKQFGIGMAFAIVVDATVVRLVLVPALMQLAGRANWWLPRWLDRLLPNLTIDPPVGATPPIAAAPTLSPAPTPLEPVQAPSLPWREPTHSIPLAEPEPLAQPKPAAPPPEPQEPAMQQLAAEAVEPEPPLPEPPAAPPEPQPALERIPPAPPVEPEQPPVAPTPTPASGGLFVWAALGAFTACAFTVGMVIGSAWAAARAAANGRR